MMMDEKEKSAIQLATAILSNPNTEVMVELQENKLYVGCKLTTEGKPDAGKAKFTITDLINDIKKQLE